MIEIRHRRSGDVILLRIEAERLAGLDLSGAWLCGAVMRGLDCTGICLRGASLRDGDLREVCLRGADLSGVSLSGATLRCCDLRGTDLRGADLSGVILEGCQSDGSTRWPENFFPPADSSTSPAEAGTKSGSVSTAGWVTCARGHSHRSGLHPCPLCLQDARALARALCRRSADNRRLSATIVQRSAALRSALIGLVPLGRPPV